MELTRLIEALAEPAAYPYPAAGVEVRQTHISAVFLAGPFAYKIKKPVSLGFVDFGTLREAPPFLRGRGPSQPPAGSGSVPGRGAGGAGGQGSAIRG